MGLVLQKLRVGVLLGSVFVDELVLVLARYSLASLVELLKVFKRLFVLVKHL